MTAALALLTSSSALAQGVDGNVSLLLALFPRVELSGRQPPEDERVLELRARVAAEKRVEIGDRLRLTASGIVEGLLGDRGEATVSSAALLQPEELHGELSWHRADLRVGFSRITWGRLDQFLPTDVVNPLDLSRFFFEGRVASKLPVFLVRGRLLPSDRVALEAIYVPVFRRARFDRLAEESSPFTVVPPALLDPAAPSRSWRNAQGGVRASATAGRVDWSATLYRGFDTFPVYQLQLRGANAPPIVSGRYPRFTMLGGDFETVRGQWGVRGEVAWFVERTWQGSAGPATSAGRSVEAGIGVDHTAGSFRLGSNVLFTRRLPTAKSPADGLIDLQDTTVTAVVDRSFARETRTLRGFAAYTPDEGSAFLRVIASQSLRDNVALEGSLGWFTGSGDDALGQLRTRDFVTTQLRVFF